MAPLDRLDRDPPRRRSSPHASLVSPTSLSHGLSRPRSIPRSPPRKQKKSSIRKKHQNVEEKRGSSAYRSTQVVSESPPHHRHPSQRRKEATTTPSRTAQASPKDRPSRPPREHAHQHRPDEDDDDDNRSDRRSMSRGRVRTHSQIGKKITVYTSGPSRLSTGGASAHRSQSAPRSATSPRLSATKFSADGAVRGCVKGGLSAHTRLAECFMMTSDIYRQECTSSSSKYRGRNLDFFVESPPRQARPWARVDTATAASEISSEDDPYHSDEDDDLRSLGERDGYCRSDTVDRDDTEVTYNDDTTEPSAAMSPPTHSYQANKDDHHQPSLLHLAKNEQTRFHDSEYEPFRSTQGRRSPEALHSDRGLHSPDLDPSPRQGQPVRRPRGRLDMLDEEEPVGPFDEDGYPPPKSSAPTGSTTDKDDLRAFRLQMFQQDRSRGKHSTEVRYSRALEDMAMQDEIIKNLQVELQGAKLTAHKTKQDLLEMRQHATQLKTDADFHSHQHFQERLEMEERLRQEITANGQLTRQVAKLQEETKQIRSRLVVGEPTHSNQPNRLKLSEDLRQAQEEMAHMTAAATALKAEMVSLKAELAEARAGRLSAELNLKQLKQSRAEIQQEAQRLKQHLQELHHDVADLRRRAEQTASRDTTECARLQDEVEGLRQQMAASRIEFRDRETQRLKLEEELTETQEEATKLRSQVADFMKRFDDSQRQADSNKAVTEVEARHLQDELQVLKFKLATTNAEIIAQATQHLKERQRLEEELLQTKEAATVLQRRIEAMDSQLVAAESETESLRQQLDERDRTSFANSASRVWKMSDEVIQQFRKKSSSILSQD